MQDKKISIFIDKQLSRYVRTNFEKYVTFIKKYFEYVESNYGPYQVTQSLEKSRDITQKYNSGVIKLKLSFASVEDEASFSENYTDYKDEIVQSNVNGVVVSKGYVVSYEKITNITAYVNIVVTSGIFTTAIGNQINFTDTTVTEILHVNTGSLLTENPNLDKLIGEISPDYPKILTANKALTIKGLADFVKAKGTEDSFRYFFRSVYNSDLEFYYPKKDMLRVSDGKWTEYKFITIKRNSDVNYLNKRIKGNTSEAIAVISRVNATEHIIDGNPVVFFELFVEDLSENFVYGETISYFDDFDLIETTDVVVTVAGSPSLLRKGELQSSSAIYTVGDEITIDNSYVDIPALKTATNIIVRITGLDTEGKLKSFDIIEHGILNYNQLSSSGTFKAYIPPSVIVTTRKVQEIVINDGGLYPSGATITATVSAPPSGTTATVSVQTSSDASNLTITSISSNVITFSANHGLALNSEIKTSVTTNGLNNGTAYFVISTPALNQVTVSTVPSGSVHTLTDGTSLSILVTAYGKKVVTGITILTNGSGYKNTPTITFNSTIAAERTAVATAYLNLAQIQFTPQTLGIEPGQFANTDGFVSWNKYIQDDYYQDFSYVLKSEEDYSDYRDIVKDLLNPAGMVFFGIISLFNSFSLNKYGSPQEYPEFFYPFKVLSFDVKSFILNTIDVPNSYRKIKIQNVQKAYGNTLEWINTDRFNIPGYQGWENLQLIESFLPLTYYYPNQYTGTNNAGYYEDDTYTFSNTPMKIVENTQINDFIKPNGLAKRTNFNREAFITIKHI